MNELRVTLLILGLIIIAGIYVWGTYLSKKNRPRMPLKRSRLRNDELFDLPSISRQSKEEPPLGKTTLESQPDTPHSFDSQPVPLKPRAQDSKTGDLFTEEEQQPAAVESKEIPIFYLVAPPGFPYSGTTIRNAAEAVGMRFGEMGVFHHYGLKETLPRESLFCLANMFEPGSFDLNQMSAYQTTGLVLFMPPSVPVDSRVAFELMLNTAQRLQSRLGGELRDSKRQPLSSAQIEKMRRQTAHGQRT